jgi:hypothetical protein
LLAVRGAEGHERLGDGFGLTAAVTMSAIDVRAKPSAANRSRAAATIC